MPRVQVQVAATVERRLLAVPCGQTGRQALDRQVQCIFQHFKVFRGMLVVAQGLQQGNLNETERGPGRDSDAGSRCRASSARRQCRPGP